MIVPTATEDVRFLATATQMCRTKRPNCGARFAMRMVQSKTCRPRSSSRRPDSKGVKLPLTFSLAFGTLSLDGCVARPGCEKSNFRGRLQLMRERQSKGE